VLGSADAAAFKARAATLGPQHTRFGPVPGVRIKPDVTMGESIADLGGVLIPLDATHHSPGFKPGHLIRAS